MDAAARVISSASREREPLLVAIDGPSGAGKSTLAEALRSRLPDVSVVHVDDFYRVMEPRESAALNAREGYERYYDWQRLAAEVLAPLRRGVAARYRRYDWLRNRLGETGEAPARGVVLVEGCYAARPELRALVDLTIYVETPRAERERRVRAREQDEDVWIARWMAAEDWYEEHHRPQEHVDLVLHGSGEPGPPGAR